MLHLGRRGATRLMDAPVNVARSIACRAASTAGRNGEVMATELPGL